MGDTTESEEGAVADKGQDLCGGALDDGRTATAN